MSKQQESIFTGETLDTRYKIIYYPETGKWSARLYANDLMSYYALSMCSNLFRDYNQIYLKKDVFSVALYSLDQKAPIDFDRQVILSQLNLVVQEFHEEQQYYLFARRIISEMILHKIPMYMGYCKLPWEERSKQYDFENQHLIKTYRNTIYIHRWDPTNVDDGKFGEGRSWGRFNKQGFFIPYQSYCMYQFESITLDHLAEVIEQVEFYIQNELIDKEGVPHD